MIEKLKWSSIGLVMLLVACGGGNNSEDGDRQGGEVTTLPAQALSVASESGCRIDAECVAGRYCFQGSCGFECKAESDCEAGELCSSRGRCLSPVSVKGAVISGDTSGNEELGAPVLSEYEPGVTVVETSGTLVKVGPGQEKARLRLKFNKSPGAEALAFTIRRDDAEIRDPRIRRAQVEGDEVEFVFPAGRAGQVDAAQSVHLTLTCSVGEFQITLQPQAREAGNYVGTATVDTFGQTGLPITMQIVTRPDNSNLEDAEEAWLVLPSANEHLFSPIEAFEGAPDSVALPLQYDDFVQAWVGTSSYEYRLGEETILVAGAGQVARSLRFEVKTNSDGLLIGEFTDRWEGLYDARSAQGVVDLVDVVFNGELELQRTGAGLSFEELPVELELPVATPKLLPAPPTDLCGEAEIFPTGAIVVGEEQFACANGLTNITAFRAGSAEEQAQCALAVAHSAMQGETTGSAIRAFLDDDVENPGGMSFVDFMEDCATGEGGTCTPSKEVVCARQVLAHAFYNQAEDGELSRQLVVAYQDVTGEAFLGRQLAAFKHDNDTRLDWLKTTDYPAIVASEVESLVTGLLDDWQSSVLDSHLGVLQGYFDSSGLAVISRASGGDASDARRRLLAQMVQSWRGSMDALVLATSRWDELYQRENQRKDRADWVRSHMLDLYLTAGVMANLTRDAGTGYQASAFGAGFAQLNRAVGKLGLSFDDLVFARDAEVVVSTSLDPTDDEDGLLTLLAEEANAEIEKASEAVLSVLEEAEAEALGSKQLESRMGNEINELRDELVALCGVPVGCTAREFRSDTECLVDARPGRCGFSLERGTGDVLNFDSGEQNVSQAGQALLALRDAYQAQGLAEAEVGAHSQKLSLELEMLDALKLSIDDRNSGRLEGAEALETLIADQSVSEDKDLADLLSTLEKKAAERQTQIDRSKTNLKNWNQIRVDGADSDFALETSASLATATADGLRNTAEMAKDFAEAGAEALPTAVGFSNDVTAPARALILMAGASVTAGMRVGAIVADGVATSLNIALSRTSSLREARLVQLEEAAGLDDAISEQTIEELERKLEAGAALSELERGNLQGTYDAAKALREAELAYAADMENFEYRRTGYLKMLVEQNVLLLRVERARLGIQRRLGEYLAVAQRGELLDAQLHDLEAQRADVNRLVGSPGVLFSRANRLSQAEARLQRAKGKLMDWLVGLEYFAVRPFVEQRLLILLARNAYQLEEISASLKAIQRRCGGRVNEDSTVLSLREDLLGYREPLTDEVSSSELSPEQRFRALLSEGNVPIDKRVRYTSDSTVGDLLRDEGRVLSATFDISLDHFANLASTCNAKVAGLAVQFVGDIGEGRPTATILYDGTSKLRSCQPGIKKLVTQIGEDRTSFGEITTLRVPGRSISPVATVNEWEEDGSKNVSLGGLPLASQYTVLIDTKIGENSDFDWSKLEDIKFQLDYVYSDVFAAGDCE